MFKQGGALTHLFDHQVTGSAWLAGQTGALLGDEMRLGKTRTVIAAVEALWRRGEVDAAVVVCFSQGLGGWTDPDPVMGQLAEYLTAPSEVEVLAVWRKRWTVEGRSSGAVPPSERDGARGVAAPPNGGGIATEHPRAPLRWTVTNYEWVRRKEHTEEVLKRSGPRTVLVLDESIAVSDYQSATARACRKIRRRCGRAWELNGTPSGNDPEDIFGQFHLLDPDIVGCDHISEFRARYAVMDANGYELTKWVWSDVLKRKVKVKLPVGVARWINLDDLAKRTGPHVLRRTMDQVFDLPEKLPPVTVEVALRPETWRIYREMKRDAVAWLGENLYASAAQAGVKALRLAQLCGGFLGGVEGDEPGEAREVGTEKLDAVVAWHLERMKERRDFKAIFWCRFRPEARRLADAIRLSHAAAGTPDNVRLLMGGSVATPDGPLALGPGSPARDEALRLMHPRTAPIGPAALVGTPSSGAMALNFAAASDAVYVSNDWSLLIREQSEARILGPDQRRAAAYHDFVAVGPKGEKTVDHAIARGLRERRDVAAWTSRAWLAALEDE
jgi:hypothetical protein